MNFPVNPAPSGDDTRIKVVKKADLAARHEAYQSHLDHEARPCRRRCSRDRSGGCSSARAGGPAHDDSSGPAR